ncbi:MAG TPA: CAP domain-containing protein [Thermoclostridium sp.]|nr:CAP domain-containing protein [Thermoclostridium sp.]
MKRRFLAASLTVFLALAAMGITGGSVLKAEAAQTFERVDFISGVVIANELNMRTGPSTKHSIIQVLKKNKWVNVLSKLGDWYVVYDPDTDKVGRVARQYLMDGETFKKQMDSGTPATPKPPAATPAPSPSVPKTTGELSPEEQQLLTLINNERAKGGLPALQADMELMRVARTKANDMVQNNYFSHYSPTYGSPFDMMRQFGISFKAAAENIAGNSTIQGAVSAWMNSSGHKANIMNASYNYTGIGIARSNKYGYVFVQMFIKK